MSSILSKARREKISIFMVENVEVSGSLCN
jgi:hypothetical protein